MAWQAMDDDKCPGCSNPMSESTAFENRTAWQVEKITCHACKMRAAKSEGASDGEFHVVTMKDGHG